MSKETAITKERLKKVNGIGPKSAEELIEALEEKGIMNFRQLKEAVDNDVITEVKGIGLSTQQELDQYITQNFDELLPEKEAEEDLRRRRPWALPQFQIWAVVCGLIMLVGWTVPRNFFALATVNNLIFVASIVVVSLWAWKNWVQIGSKEAPAQAVLTEFFNPIDVVGTDRYFFFWPIESGKEFPTTSYKMPFVVSDGVYTKEGEDNEEASQPVSVKVKVYAHFPNRNETYTYPMPREEAKERGVEFEPIESDYTNREDWVWGKILGKELLMKRSYPRLPIDNLTKEGTVHKLGNFLEGGVEGAIRGVLQSNTMETVKEKTDKIESEIKSYLLVEEGNPFYEIGLPRENLDIEIKETKFDEDTEQAIKDVQNKAHAAEAAKSEAKAIERKMAAFTSQGASADVAAVKMGEGAKGESFDIADLRDIKFIEQMSEGEFSKREIERIINKQSPKQPSSRSLEEFINEQVDGSEISRTRLEEIVEKALNDFSDKEN